MDPPQIAHPIRLAERIATTARELGIETAVIGAMALAAHKYLRATKDVDLATAVDIYPDLRDLRDRLGEMGLSTRLTTPDDQDDLGGVLRVWEREDEEGDPIEPVEIVNFRNPYRPRRSPGPNAIKNAIPAGGDSTLRYVRLPDLIALKLDANSQKDFGDIVEVLKCNPGADLDEIRAVAGPFDRRGKLEELLAEAVESWR